MSTNVVIPKDVALQIATFLSSYEQMLPVDALVWLDNHKEVSSLFVAHSLASDSKIMHCPECGSGDVAFCYISVRPHCNECNAWGSINYDGTREDAIKAWNVKAILAGR